MIEVIDYYIDSDGNITEIVRFGGDVYSFVTLQSGEILCNIHL